jgi:hypothetical protein
VFDTITPFFNDLHLELVEEQKWLD